MTLYFLLIVIILLVSLIPLKKNQNNIVLIISMWCLFLVMALKAPSVGRDIEGYQHMYNLMQFASWSNYDLSWMEGGYEFLMMVFTHIFHASFQTFLACIYAFVYFSYFCFFKRYSKDYTTTLLLYICFTFFTFDTSAIRNMIGLAICLFAIPVAEKKGFLNFLIFTGITLLATQFHKSAYIFFAVYFIIKIPFSSYSSLIYIGAPAALFLLRNSLYSFINNHLKTVEETNIAIGGNLLMYILCLVFCFFVWILYDRKIEHQEQTLSSSTKHAELNALSTNYFSTSGLAMRMIYTGIILQLFGSGTVLTRMAQYMQFFILILIPNNLARFTPRTRFFIKCILYTLLILYFWKYSLLENALDIVPYKFFWS